MLTRILTIVANVGLNVLISHVKLWWAQRQAAYFQRKAEIEKKRRESLKEGKAKEELIAKAGTAVIINSEKARTWQDRVAELKRRAAERAAEKDKEDQGDA
jgi:hypothetical protein